MFSEGLVVAKVFVIHDQSLPLQPHKEYIEGWLVLQLQY